jgi:hypothetical protein
LLYNAADQVYSVTTPDPQSPGNPAQTTLTSYNNMGQATGVTYPDKSTVANEYYLTGELKKTYGSRTYPVSYGYDYAGRMIKMTNWSSFASSAGARVTTWNYDSYRGWLNSKDYPNATTGAAPTTGTGGPTYTYTSGGRLSTRTWKRVMVTTYLYGFNDGTNLIHPDLSKVSYTSGLSTPSRTFVYNRMGQMKTVKGSVRANRQTE